MKEVYEFEDSDLEKNLQLVKDLLNEIAEKAFDWDFTDQVNGETPVIGLDGKVRITFLGLDNPYPPEEL